MNKAEEFIACLEGEIAKRDAWIMELNGALKYVSDEFDCQRAELAAIKAQDTVGEVVGWYRLDRPYEMTSYPSVCATWHRLGAPVAPLYAAPVQQVSVPDGKVCVPVEVLRLYEFMASSFTPFTSQHEQIAISLRKAKAAMLAAAAPAAPAADALVEALETAVDYLNANYLSSISSGSTLHRKLRAAIAAHRANGVV